MVMPLWTRRSLLVSIGAIPAAVFLCSYKTCPACSGTGRRVTTERLERPCATCGGRGTIEGPCVKCNGTGSIVEEVRCPECKGAGELRCEYTTEYVETPAVLWFKETVGSYYCSGGHLKCSNCNVTPLHEGDVCPRCNGRGFLPCATCAGHGFISKTATCTTCGGKGTVTTACRSCDGKGKVKTVVSRESECSMCSGAGKIRRIAALL